MRQQCCDENTPESMSYGVSIWAIDTDTGLRCKSLAQIRTGCLMPFSGRDTPSYRPSQTSATYLSTCSCSIEQEKVDPPTAERAQSASRVPRKLSRTSLPCRKAAGATLSEPKHLPGKDYSEHPYCKALQPSTVAEKASAAHRCMNAHLTRRPSRRSHFVRRTLKSALSGPRQDYRGHHMAQGMPEAASLAPSSLPRRLPQRYTALPGLRFSLPSPRLIVWAMRRPLTRS